MRWWHFFRTKLDEGRQGFVIAPLVEDSEAVEAANVQATFETLSRGELANYRLGLLHGRMTPAEKDAAMQAFRLGRTQVLVATSVVEVGIDVPNATLMTIEGGERFGLAQLHQLRGRISRGSQPGYLCVFATPASDETQERLEAFTKTSDGFALAELDFQLRGPGDLFGIKQHGLPPLRIADLRRDAAVVDEARQDAQQLIESDPELADPAYSRLRRMVFHRYGEALDLGDVG
jgi:ATP-dependent DNA helicase RecG